MLNENKRSLLLIGRFNPPHKGHIALIDIVCTESKKRDAHPIVLIIDSGKLNKDNPLSGLERLELLKNINNNVRYIIASNAYDGFSTILDEGIDIVGCLCGSDRNNTYVGLYGRLCGHEALDGFSNIIIERDQKNTDWSSLSSTRVRQSAFDGDYSLFLSMTPYNNIVAHAVYTKIRQRMVDCNGTSG